MIRKILALAGLSVLTLSANAALVTVDHNVTSLPPSYYLPTDLDNDGIVDINLASNFYVSIWGGDTRFSSRYSLVGEVIDADETWQQGNTWLDFLVDVKYYANDGYLYLGVRHASLGDYYGYITFNYDAVSNSVSLNSFTYDNSGAAITVRPSEVPLPAASWLFGSAVLGLAGFKRRK